jgi:MerR family transcriptional regulator/heat shock protein HspR
MADKGKPLYLISVVADMLTIHPQTLRLYERRGLIRPSRTLGRTRLYSAEDVEEIQRVLRLTRDLGVNLAGVEIILKMRRRMLEMQRQTEDLLSYVRQESGRPGDGRGAGEALVKAATGRLRKLDDF